jgi:hypothetical protein
VGRRLSDRHLGAGQRARRNAWPPHIVVAHRIVTLPACLPKQRSGK